MGATAYEAMAKALQAQGLQGAALRAMRDAVQLDPMNLYLRVRHGIARAAAGDHPAAVREYEVVT